MDHSIGGRLYLVYGLKLADPYSRNRHASLINVTQQPSLPALNTSTHSLYIYICKKKIPLCKMVPLVYEWVLLWVKKWHIQTEKNVKETFGGKCLQNQRENQGSGIQTQWYIFSRPLDIFYGNSRLSRNCAKQTHYISLLRNNTKYLES